MEYKTTFTRVQSPKSRGQGLKPGFGLPTSNFRLTRQAGFTLVELMIASAVAGLLLAVCASLTLYTARGIASVTDSVDLNARSRLAIDRMSQKLRQASSVKSFSPTSVSVTLNNGQLLSYSYNASRKALVEVDAGVTNDLVENCEGLSFAIYKRNPMEAQFNYFDTTSVLSEAKMIQVNWFCHRTLVGKKSGAAEMVSAKIVIRAK